MCGGDDWRAGGGVPGGHRMGAGGCHRDIPDRGAERGESESCRFSEHGRVGGFPKERVLPYVVAQFCGAFVASAVLYFVFGDALKQFERANGISRGQPGSEASAMVFGEFFPNPGGHPLTPEARVRMSPGAAFGAEVIATAVLLLVICCCTDERNKARPQPLTAAAIGLTVTLLISLLGPLTMACFNPARDLGPRVFSALAGWGIVPFQVNGTGWWTVYIIAPVLGGLLGGGIYTACFKRAYAVDS